MNAVSTHWQSRPEGGSRFALWLLRSIALHGGRCTSRALMPFIALYFFLRRAPERQASRQFLARVQGHPASAWQVFRHIHTFGCTMLDRVFLLARGARDFDVELEGTDVLDGYLAQGRGLLLLGSHLGSFEALRAIAGRCPHVQLRVVLDKQKTPLLTELLEALAPDVGARVIDAAQDGASIALALAEACGEGAMVALLGDRGRGHEQLRHASFLGSPAPFPVSPWLLASTLKVPVALCFGIYLGGNRYRLVFEPFAAAVDIPRAKRAEALDALIARYAARMECYARAYPYNWFNFYDFWQQDGYAPSRTGAAVGASCEP